MERISEKRANKFGYIAYVQEMSEEGPGKKYALSKQKSLIGRNVKAEISLLSRNVSRNHAYLEWKKDLGWCITDNRSINGVYVDEKRIHPAEPHPMKNGMCICLGPPELTEFWLQFHVYPLQRVGQKGNESERDLQFENVRETRAEDPGSSNSSVVVRGGSGRQTRSSQKRSVGYYVPAVSPQKKHCSRKSKSEQSLEERLASVDSLLKMNEAHEKRIEQMLNESDERLTRECLTEESTSLLPAGTPAEVESYSSDSMVTNYLENMEQPMSQRQRKQNHRKKKTASINNNTSLESGPSQLQQLKFQEISDLKEKVALLQKELQEEEQEKLALRKQLEEKEILLEEQEQKKLLDKNKEEMLKSNLEEAKSSLQQTVNAEVANQFGKLMESEFTCSICTELFIKATSLDCAHTFCTDCITKWKKTKKVCPICRSSINGSSRSLAIDSFIDKMVEKLSPEDQKRRKEIVEERTRVPEKKKPIRKKRVVTTRSTRQRRSQRLEQLITDAASSFLMWNQDSSAGIQEDPVGMLPFGEIEYPAPNYFDDGGGGGDDDDDDDDSDDSSVEGYGSYGGYGRCYNCGRTGHWANGCPEA